MALLDESEWASHYELTFSLWLERAECEFLIGGLDRAEQLIVELLRRCASKIDLSAAYCLKVLLHVVRSEYSQAVASALTSLRLFGIDLPAHPTWGQVQADDARLMRDLLARHRGADARDQPVHRQEPATRLRLTFGSTRREGRSLG